MILEHSDLSFKLSGTEILDAIENETSGTLKKCYIALGQLKCPRSLNNLNS